MSVALEAVEQVFCWSATGRTVNKPRLRVRVRGDVIAGKAPGRPGPRAVTLFESQGLAMQDVVVGARVLERARRQAVGREIDFGGGHA